MGKIPDLAGVRPRCGRKDGEMACDGVRGHCAAKRERGTKISQSVLLVLSPRKTLSGRSGALASVQGRQYPGLHELSLRPIAYRRLIAGEIAASGRVALLM